MHAQPFEQLLTAWRDVETNFMVSEPIQRLTGGELRSDHYASWLRETYFYTRENPQIQAMATAWFRDSARGMVKPFLQHAISEVGHDRMALDDLASLGFSVDGIPIEEPLLATIPLIAFPFYGIQYRSPFTYLGYLFFLEFLPTSRGAELAASIRGLGVDERGMTFLKEHNTVDVHHNKAMKLYADTLLQSPGDVREVIYAMRVTGYLYAGMVKHAFDTVDNGTSPLLRARSS